MEDKFKNQWTPEFGLEYWKAEDDHYYIENLREKSLIFNVDYFLRRNFGGAFGNNVKDLIAVDIGGGAYGGALRFCQEFGESILVDKLAPQYREMGKLPNWVDTVTADFEKIPIQGKTVDVVFAWNVYDHARSKSHFIIGMMEAKRLLKPGGLFFGSFPMLSRPREGHPVCIEEYMIERQLHRHDVLKRGRVGKPLYSDDTFFIVATPKKYFE